MRYFAGIDIGSTMTKVVIMRRPPWCSRYRTHGAGTSEAGAQGDGGGARLGRGLAFDDLAYIVATGYGRINVPFADKQVTEITCHAKGIHSLLPNGEDHRRHRGQDSKGIRIENGKVVSFVMNDKCAAGTGRFLEVIADALGVPLNPLGELSLSADEPAVISNTCTVFAEAGGDFPVCRGETVPNLIAGVHDAIATRSLPW